MSSVKERMNAIDKQMASYDAKQKRLKERMKKRDEKIKQEREKLKLMQNKMDLNKFNIISSELSPKKRLSNMDSREFGEWVESLKKIVLYMQNNPDLAKKVQDLTRENDSLRSKLHEQKSTINTLENRLNNRRN